MAAILRSADRPGSDGVAILQAPDRPAVRRPRQTSSRARGQGEREADRYRVRIAGVDGDQFGVAALDEQAPGAR
jgi:hypothetical protein